MLNKTMHQDRNFEPVMAAEDFPASLRLEIVVEGKKIVIFKVDGAYYAVESVCSHDNGLLREGELHGFEVKCMQHGARFDIRSGKALSLPATIDLETYPVRVVNGNLEIGI